ncbi:MAG: M15 family metallopeptidase [Lachnospiraceae bacterium]
MKKTCKEKILNRLVRIGKKNKLLKIPMMIVITLVLGFFNFLSLIVGNTKKIVSFTCLMLFFFMGNSFASIGFLSVANTKIDVAVLGEQIPEETTDSMVDNIELINDMDFTDGYEDTEKGSADADRYGVDEILDENSKHIVKNQIALNQTEGSAISKDDWRLLLINKQHPIPDDYVLTLSTIKNDMQCDSRILDDLLAMLQGAKQDGINLVICSPYRDLNHQEFLFNRKIKAYMNQGMSYMEAYKISSQAVTVPGASEHQLGLALDIVCDSYIQLEEQFGETEAGKWLKQHSCEYGFILRYPKGKEAITGIEYEPWHYRYVGKESATIIMNHGLTLEEFVQSLP